MSAYPTFQPENLAAFFGQAVISPPASNVGAPAVPQLFAGSTLAAPPQFSYFGLESFDTLGGDLDFPLRVNLKSQELSLPGSPHSALGRVDFQTQMLGYPIGNAGQHSFSGPLAAHINVAVVGVAAERQAAPVQLLVQRV